MQSKKKTMFVLVAGLSFFGALSSVNAAEKATSHDATNNSAVNERDRDNKTLTPGDQSQTKGDVELAARVRRAVVDHEGVSMDGKNIKIIAINNAVTLRGPVKDAAERTAIEKTARTAAGTSVTVDSQLEVR